jgi:hypothetical protein
VANAATAAAGGENHLFGLNTRPFPGTKEVERVNSAGEKPEFGASSEREL